MPDVAARARALAEEFRQSAEEAVDPADRAHYEHVAESWVRLAESIDFLKDEGGVDADFDVDLTWALRVRARAHEIWVADGRPEGKAAEHWEQATRELHAKDDP